MKDVSEKLKSLVKIELIKTYMKNNNLSKTEFCRKCKINIATFNKINSGQNYRLNMLFKIADVMNLKIYEVLN